MQSSIIRRVSMASGLGMCLSSLVVWPAAASDYFAPESRIAGIGASRGDLPRDVLDERSRLMVESQTFAILRDPRAVAGAQRIHSPELQKIFQQAERVSGLPASLISAIAYLESWGDRTVQSPAGPKGIMQIAAATARSMGLRIVYSTKYRVEKTRVQVRSRKKNTSYKTVRRKVPYTVLVRDERMTPSKAVPAAARYLAGLTNRYGGQDWAIFAYHCGEGCVQEMRSITDRARGIEKPLSVAAMFFGASPALNQDLYEAIQHHMDRDYSPTYWFRIMRAQQLLGLYKEDPAAFRKLADEYRNQDTPDQRSPHRLSVWLKTEDLLYDTCDDLRRDQGKRLARAFENADFFGFRLRKTGKNAIGSDDLSNQQYYLQATPSALGTLTYIAFETRRLHEAMRPSGEKFVPLEVTSLVRPRQSVQKEFELDIPRKTEAPSHCSGQVFDIDVASLPPGERQALQFVLTDMGWNGYLGFVEETPRSGMLHIGCAPSSRDFFSKVYDEALAVRTS